MTVDIGEKIPRIDKELDLRSLGSEISKAIGKHVGEKPASHWSIIIQDVDKDLLKDMDGARTNYRDKPREIILVFEKGNITLISERFKIGVCDKCGLGVIGE